jgi:Gpi18-like mannosyltransferase
MISLIAYLRRIVGRIKKYMSGILIGIASFLFPSALYVKIEMHSLNWAIVLTIIAGLALGWSIYFKTKEDNNEEQKFTAQYEASKAISIAFINEIKRLNENISDLLNEIRKDRNERNDTDKPNDNL